ncbi:MAG: ArsR/SmtB family transcription factor [Gemmatimonadaceae bacterium]
MVNYSSTLDTTFSALADPVRRTMLGQLRGGEASVGELAAPHAITLAAMLKHVRYLERAGLVRARKEGRTRICRLVPKPLASVDKWLSHYRDFWQGQLDSLDRYLQRSTTGSSTWKPPHKTSASRSDAPMTPRRPSSSPRGPTRKR